MSSKIEVVEHPNYRTINYAGSIGVASKDKIHITIYSDDLNCTDLVSDPKLKEGQINTRRVIECRILLDPSASKSLQTVVNSTVADYEKRFGEIKKPNKIADASEDKRETNVSTPYT